MIKCSCKKSDRVYLKYKLLIKDGKKRHASSHEKEVELLKAGFTYYIKKPKIKKIKVEKRKNQIWSQDEILIILQNCIISETKTQKLNKLSKLLPSKTNNQIYSKLAQLKLLQNLTKRVMCVELKKEFKSIGEATRWLGRQGLTYVLDHPNKTLGGYHWISLK